MKVILLEDVRNLGKKGDVVDAKSGYAQNFLFPRKLAVEATPANIRNLELQQRNQAKRDAERLAEAQALKTQLEKLQIEVPVKAGEGGRIFGSVTSMDITDAIEKQGLTIDRRTIDLATPIKDLGDYQVVAKLHPEVTAQLHVRVSES